MTNRHKAYKSTLDRGYASEWNDDHIEDFHDEIDFFLDFIRDLLSNAWDFAQTSGGSNPAVTLVGGAGAGHSFVVFNTGATTGNKSSMRKELAGAVGNITSPDDYPLLTCTLQVATVHIAGLVVEFGFLNSSDNIFLANQDGAYFRIEDNTLYAVTGNGTTETTTDLGVFSEYAQYRIMFVSVGGVDKVYFYVDDMVNPVASHTTNLPDSNLTIKFSIQSQNNVDSTMRLDACSLKILRKK